MSTKHSYRQNYKMACEIIEYKTMTGNQNLIIHNYFSNSTIEKPALVENYYDKQTDQLIKEVNEPEQMNITINRTDTSEQYFEL